MAKLNLGCGPDWQEQYPDYEGLDIHNYGQKWVREVLEWLRAFKADDYYDEIMANHFLEHFSWDDNRTIFNSVRRILKPGGLFKITVPHLVKPRAWIPSHRSYWNEDVARWFGEEETVVYGWQRWQVKEVVNNSRKDLHIWLIKI